MSWLPCGRAFKVHDQKEFASLIMPRYFRHSRFKSFLRQLSMYKFQRITEGPNRGAYFHPAFLRDNVELCRSINRGDKIPLELTFTEGSSTPSSVSAASNRSVSPYGDATPTMQPSLTISMLDSDLLGCNFDASRFAPDDRKLLRSTLSWSSQSSTPVDILDEIITTFAVPQTAYHIEEDTSPFLFSDTVF
jgi:hypothetical protein